MGYDVSYHPISEEQINLWYWKGLEDLDVARVMALEVGMEEFYVNKYIDTLKAGQKVDLTESFEHTHGYYIAVVQGFFEKFFYTRGGVISFSENGVLDSYFTPWEKIVINREIKGRIEDNYCSGVYMSASDVVRLLEGYENDQAVNNELNELFSYRRINIFLRALKYAKERNLGLLEATEVIEPNPFDLNLSECYSNLFNCDKEGPLLFAEIAQEQLEEVKEQQDKEVSGPHEKEEVTRNVISPNEVDLNSSEIPEVTKKDWKSFWKSLFR